MRYLINTNNITYSNFNTVILQVKISRVILMTDKHGNTTKGNTYALFVIVNPFYVQSVC